MRPLELSLRLELCAPDASALLEEHLTQLDEVMRARYGTDWLQQVQRMSVQMNQEFSAQPLRVFLQPEEGVLILFCEADERPVAPGHTAEGTGRPAALPS